MKNDKSYLVNITALRGIAALLVVVFHANELVDPFIKTDATWLFRKLYLMVDLFFILSGFIMCYVYESYFNKPGEKGKIKSFLKARFARIYPLHIITLCVCVTAVTITYSLGKYGYLGPVGMAVNNFKAIPSNVLLLQSAHIEKVFTWNVPSWSISAEWLAYLIFPFLVKPFSRFTIKQVFALTGLIFLLYAGLIYYIAPNRPMPFPFFVAHADLDVTFDWGFARGILGFVLGMCIYRMYLKNVFRSYLSNIGFLFAIVIAYCVYMHFNLPDIAAPAFFSIILLIAAYGSKSVNTFFGNPVLQRLGDWSFSIYMWHIVLFTVVNSIKVWQLQQPPVPGPPTSPDYFGLTNTWVILIAYIGITIIVGALSYRVIEKPTRKWINSWGRKER